MSGDDITNGVTAGAQALPHDSRLLERVATGDTQALAELFARYHASLYRLALGIVSDPEAAQEIIGGLPRDVLWAARNFSPSHYPVSRWLADMTRVAALEHLQAHSGTLTSHRTNT